MSPSKVEFVTLNILLFERRSSMSFFCRMKPLKRSLLVIRKADDHYLSGREMSWLWLRSTYTSCA